jgi:hypothetical protein
MNVGHENQPTYDGAAVQQLTVGVTAVQLPATDGGVAYLRAKDADITLGSSNAVTAGGGFTIASGTTSPPVTLTSLALLWAITTGAGKTLEILVQK